jgi:hypothetical protein
MNIARRVGQIGRRIDATLHCDTGEGAMRRFVVRLAGSTCG